MFALECDMTRVIVGIAKTISRVIAVHRGWNLICLEENVNLDDARGAHRISRVRLT